MSKLVIFVAIILSGCATTKPLQIACLSCGLLEASGMCGGASTLGQQRRPQCPEGQRYEIVNYQSWLDGEEPVIECRKIR